MSPGAWHARQWQSLRQSVAANRLAHGLLLAAAEGVGGEAFATALAESLLCDSPTPEGLACGGCRACRLLAAGSHPDLLRLGPEGDSRSLKVEQVRALGGFLALSRHAAAHKVALLAPAEALNLSAANALLKTLEEPPPGAVLILLAASPNRLPATVRSRCQRIDLDRIDREAALAWLQAELGVDPTLAATLLAVSRDRPLLARELGAEPEGLALRARLLGDLARLAGEPALALDIAAEWAGEDPARLLGWLGGLLGDLARTAAGAPGEGLCNPDLAAQLRRLAERLDWRAPLRLLEAVTTAEALLRPGSTVRARDVLEDLTLRWARASEGGTRTGAGVG